MTRTIKASEVKPGMEVQIITRMKIQTNVKWNISHRDMRDDAGCVARVDADTPVTVLSEPQPEEPTEFGARVVAGERKFVRGQNDAWPWVESLDGEIYNWGDVCNEGQVTVIDANPSWTVPDTPEVPERIEEWPEDDEHLRAYRWVGSDECEWRYVGNGEWRFVTRLGNWSYPHPRPCDGPWDRVTDA